MINNSHGKRMVSENLIKILKEMDSKNISIGDLAEVLENFADGDVQMKLTAGDNVQISEDNVISATDTTYTAGANITIENGVISASAGQFLLYEHNINLFKDDTDGKWNLGVKIITTDNTPFTLSSLNSFLNDKGYVFTLGYTKCYAGINGLLHDITSTPQHYGGEYIGLIGTNYNYPSIVYYETGSESVLTKPLNGSTVTDTRRQL